MPSALLPTTAIATTSIFLAQALSAAIALSYGLAFAGFWVQWRRRVMLPVARGWLVFGLSSAMAPLLVLTREHTLLAKAAETFVIGVALSSAPNFLQAAALAAGHAGIARRAWTVLAPALAVVLLLGIWTELPWFGGFVRGSGPRLVSGAVLAVSAVTLLTSPRFEGRILLVSGLALLAARMLGGAALEWAMPGVVSLGGQPTAFTVFQLLTTMLAGFYLGAAVLAMERGERIALERELAASQRLQSLGRLSSGVAHDFNNVLTVVVSATDLATSSTATAEDRQQGQAHVAQAVASGRELTRQLLSFARPETNREAFDVVERVRKLAPMLDRVVGPTVAVRRELGGAGAIATVDGDPVQFDQVLLNLAANARDAMPTGGELRISVDPDVAGPAGVKRPGLRHVLVTATDTGVGIDAEHIDRIFEPFFTTKGDGKGTGLGLATAFAFAQHAGGTLTVESMPGNGTTFRLYLPVRAA